MQRKLIERVLMLYLFVEIGFRSRVTDTTFTVCLQWVADVLDNTIKGREMAGIDFHLEQQF